ncbi:MAG TPA: NAD(P)H-dependent oxidoreductase [Longimicrobiaceae bacterium]|nr:NAD(P)H-dependent oxidoreductase [Longimicrobiaceae bacterium]
MVTSSSFSSTTERDPLRVLAIAGSLRRGSYNRLLLEAAAELAPDGIRVEVFDELASIPLFDEDLEAATGGGPAAVAALRERVALADGLLIATPEYNHSMPGVLKNVLDWLSRGDEPVLAGKPAAVVGVTGGQWGTRLAQAAVRQVLYSTGSPVLPAPAVFVRGAGERFDAAGRLTDGPTRAALERLLDAFGEWIRRVAPREAGVR